MATYYIDPLRGSEDNDGLTSFAPKPDYKALAIQPGDTIYFAKGSVFRESIQLVSGTEDAPVTYTAYGEGPMPVFCGSQDISDPSDWVEEAPHIWRCLKSIDGDVGNLIFNETECTATLRWSEEELTSQGDFYDSRFGEGNSQSDETVKIYSPQRVLLYSEINPGVYYDHIEAAAYADRILCRLESNVIIDGLCFKNSGVHAIASDHGADNVILRNCRIENIGGVVWNRDLKIRFGNGFEIWQYANDILVENCSFYNIYDSCVTHQGPGEETTPAQRFICRNNTFDTYGMAAFEYRDKLPIDSEFVSNTCLNAGSGFAMLGEELPRRSEIWPQPMGHHIFLWRIEQATEGGSVRIADNHFGSAPVGSAIYSIITKEAEAQIVLENNMYGSDENYLIKGVFGYELH